VSWGSIFVFVGETPETLREPPLIATEFFVALQSSDSVVVECFVCRDGIEHDLQLPYRERQRLRLVEQYQPILIHRLAETPQSVSFGLIESWLPGRTTTFILNPSKFRLCMIALPYAGVLKQIACNDKQVGSAAVCCLYSSPGGQRTTNRILLEVFGIGPTCKAEPM
jgi:hypothetical protein